MRGPFVAGGPSLEAPIETPDANTRRIKYQNRGQNGLASTLSLGNDSVLNAPTPKEIPEPEGVGDGNQPHSGNAFHNPATPKYELNGSNGVVPSTTSAMGKQETPPPNGPPPAPPFFASTPAEAPTNAKVDPLYADGAYWKFLGPL